MATTTTTTSIISPTFTSLGVQTIASVGGTYIPPFATLGTGSANPIPTATTTTNNPNPTTPAFLNDYDWINSYLLIHSMSNPSYRYAYILWLIIALVVAIFGFLHLTGRRGGAWGARWAKWALRRRTWRKKSVLRSNTPHKQPWSLPSNAQILSLVILFVIPAILCTIGSDYIAPGTAVWDLTHNMTMTRRHLPNIDIDQLFRRGPPIASTATTRPPDFTIAKEWWTAGGRTGIIAFSLFPLVVLFSLKAPPFAIFAIPFTVQIHFDKLARLHRWLGRLIWLICAAHVVTWSIQLYHDHRHGHPGRAWAFVWVYHKFTYGIIAFVALTLLVLLSTGPVRSRFYEVFYVSHILLVPTTLVFSALHYPPIWWWCWAPLLLWVMERTYRMAHLVYLNGILDGAGSQKIVNSSAAFAYPEDEKLGRVSGGAAGGYVGVRPFEANTPTRRSQPLHQHQHSAETWEMEVRRGKSSDGGHGRYNSDSNMLEGRERMMSADLGDRYRDSGMTDESTGEWSPGTAVDYRSADSHAPKFSSYPPQQGTSIKQAHPAPVLSSTAPGMRSSLSHLNFPAMHPLTSILAPPSSCISKLPPPGYAKAILLPGRTIRISLITARRFTWSPGQHILLTIPSISRFTSHPFTVASVSDTAIAGAHGREMVLVIRAKRGFTKKLWEKVKKQTLDKKNILESEASMGSKKSRATTAVSGDYFDPESGAGGAAAAASQQTGAGVTFRAWVDGPFGSSVRAHWGSHSSVVIICGGSGVSFGTSILEYLCLCLSGRDGRSLGGKSGGVGKDSFVTRRVRFLWLVREYSHLQWCAPIIRRCMDMMPNKQILQVDIFVTNFADSSNSKSAVGRSVDLNSVYIPKAGTGSTVDDPLAPPAPRFAREGKLERRMSVSSDDSNDSNVSFADLHYAGGGKPGDGNDGELESDDGGHVLDLTNFDGDDDTHAPGEAQLSLKLKKEGRLRRAASRKVATAAQAKMELAQRAAAATAAEPTARVVPPSAYKSPTKSRQWDVADSLLSPVTSPRNGEFEKPKWGVPSRVGTPGDRELGGANRPYSDYQNQNRMSTADSFQEHSPTQSTRILHNPLDNDTQTIGGSESMRHLMSGGMDTAPGTPAMINIGDDVILEYDDEELDDLNAVSEVARPGKPRLERILKDEVERSKGAIAVACCGPTSLNALTRKLVASMIDPARIQRGDLRGQITLTSEEFEW